MARSRRTPAMLVGTCCSELSNHELQAKLKKVTSSERSASRIYRVTQHLVARSRRTPAALILPMLFRPFHHRTCTDLGKPPTTRCVLPEDPVLGLAIKKLRAASVRYRPPRSFDSAPPSAVLGDKSVTRSAQDDDSVGVLAKNIPNKFPLMGLRPG